MEAQMIELFGVGAIAFIVGMLLMSHIKNSEVERAYLNGYERGQRDTMLRGEGGEESITSGADEALLTESGLTSIANDVRDD